MKSSEEPTAEQVEREWDICIQMDGECGTFYNLVDIRQKKFTWLGKKENDLRIAIDKYIANFGVYEDEIK